MHFIHLFGESVKWIFLRVIKSDDLYKYLIIRF